MKGYTLLYSIIILLAVSACTQDDLSTPAGGVEGIPMTFSAMGLPQQLVPVPPWTATGKACRAWQS